MAGFTRRKYAGAAKATTITGSINSVATTMTIAAYTGWPNGSDPFYVVVDADTSSEEKMLVTRSGSSDTTLTVVSGGRGVDGTTATSHSSGASIFPVFTAVDADEANIVASTLTTKGDILVHTGSAHARQAVGSNNAVLAADSAQTNGVVWTASPTLTLTNSTGLPVSGITASTSTALGVGSVELGHASDTTIARVSAGRISVEGVNVVTVSSTDTLTNKTVALGSNTVSGTLAEFNTAVTDADLVSLAGTETLTNKTLTSPTITGGTATSSIMVSPEERWTVSATAATGTVNVDVATTTAWYYTSNASANWTFNFRGNSGTTLASSLNTGDSVTVAFAVTNGTTAYYPTAFQVDGSSVTPMWQQGSAPAAGSASAVDLYVFTIIKTAATPTYAVFASQTKFD